MGKGELKERGYKAGKTECFFLHGFLYAGVD